MRRRAARAALLRLLLLPLAIALGGPAFAQEVTPPRLAFIDGPVSFLRAGAADWASARVNTPLAAGDRLYVGPAGNIEIQVGARAFVRAAQNTELGFIRIEPQFLQVEAKSGTVSLDLRSVPAGTSAELDTPFAVFTIDTPGYYRADIGANAAQFITRRAGRAMVSLEGGAAQLIASSEEAVVSAGAPPVTYIAPQPDAWDQWNYARTDHEIESLSGRYVPPGVYGAASLDEYGNWRVVAEYGPVWVPRSVPPNWAPYSSGSWIWDPVYGWTWVDDAPWGWAPFHYGRWVYVNGFWGWAPGPIVVGPAYAPALVGFYAIGAVSIGWVALSWNEPVHPWWGHHAPPKPLPPGGVLHNALARGLVVVDRDKFGAGHIRGQRVAPRDPRELKPIAGAPEVRPTPRSFEPAPGRRAVRPPATITSRPIVTTRPPREAPAKSPPPKIVTPPVRVQPGGAPAPRPQLGQRGPERRPPAPAPRYEQFRRTLPPSAPITSVPRATAPVMRAQPNVQPRTLPGRPANEMNPNRGSARSAPSGRAAPSGQAAPSGRAAPSR